MTSRARWALLAVLLVAFGAAVVVAGQRDEGPPPLAGVERLGPEAGEPVAHYVARASASLPEPGAGEAWALVQLERSVDAEAAAALVRDVRLSRVVLRVPLPRVQTALVTRPVPGQRPVPEIAGAIRSAAQERGVAARQAPAGSRAAAVAAAEARLFDDGCACVVAMLVRADRAGLDRVAARAPVRAVHAARVGTPPSGLALAPLLPEQVDVAGPVPDDGSVP